MAVIIVVVLCLIISCILIVLLYAAFCYIRRCTIEKQDVNQVDEPNLKLSDWSYMLQDEVYFTLDRYPNPKSRISPLPTIPEIASF
jgi:hypothetical protein